MVNLYADDTIVYCVADSVELTRKNLQYSFDVLQEALKCMVGQNKTVVFLSQIFWVDQSSDTSWKWLH